MEGNELLREFVKRLGQRLLEGAAEAQESYDVCDNHEQFVKVQLLRGLLLKEIPDNLSDILTELLEYEKTIDFWEYAQVNVSGLLVQKRGWLKRLLRKLSE